MKRNLLTLDDVTSRNLRSCCSRLHASKIISSVAYRTAFWRADAGDDL